MSLSPLLQRLADMSGRTALITGGFGHLGLLMADTLAGAGARLILVDRAEAPEPPGRLAALRASGPGSVEVLRADLGDPQSVEALIASVLEIAPRLDVLINNAAFVGTSASEGWATSFETQSVDLWRKAVEINLTTPFRLAQGLLPALRASDAASVINVASIYGLVGPDWHLYEGTAMGNPAAYAASKGGLVQLTRYLATTLAPHVRVNTLAPGGIERGQAESFQSRYVARAPLGRMASLEDFAGATLFLASRMSSYVTGQTLAVDGGWTAW
jgi:NAD(P)-dependent dehydrogenase (short-subunit alcohol dehydrogenase family)